MPIIVFCCKLLSSKKAKGFCEEFLIENLAAKNVFGVRQLGEFFLSVALIERTNTFLSNHFVAVTCVGNEEFLVL